MSAQRIAPPLAVLLVSIVVYVNAIGNQFALDDALYVQSRERVHVTNVADIVSSPYYFDANSGLYRPVTVLSFAINRAITGEAPWGFHLVNVLLHAVTSVLVYALARRLAGSDVAALAAGLLFAVHPIHTEAVSYVSGRADVLATLFGVAALLVRPIPGALLLLLALLSKESAIAIVPALAILPFLCESPRPSLGRIAARLAPAAIAVAVMLVARAAVLGSPLGLGRESIPPLDNATIDAPWASRAATGFAVLLRCLGKLLLPTTLSADYSTAQIPVVTLGDPLAMLGLVAVVGLVAVAWLVRDSRPAVAFGCALLVLAWLPVSNVVVPIGTLMAERLLYLPSVGFALALGAVVPASSRAARAIGIVILALLATRTLVRNADWKDDETIYEAAVRASPRAARARASLGFVCYDKRKAEADSAAKRERTNRAEAHAREAIRLHPTYGKAHLLLGSLLAEKRLWSEAAREYDEAEKDTRGVDGGALVANRATLGRFEARDAMSALERGERELATSLALHAAAVLRAAVPARALAHDIDREALAALVLESADACEAIASELRVAGLGAAADALDASVREIRAAFSRP